MTTIPAAYFESPTHVTCGELETQGRTPALAMCRKLAALGRVGTLEVYWRSTGTHSLTLDIERAAQLSITENDRGIQERPYVPNSRFPVPRSSQDGDLGSGGTPGTPGTKEAPQ